MPEKNLNGFAKLIGLLEFRFAFDVTHIHITSGQNMTKVFPMQVFHQVIIIEDGIIKAVTFSSRANRRSKAVRNCPLMVQ